MGLTAHTSVGLRLRSCGKQPRRLFAGNGGCARYRLDGCKSQGGREGIEAARWLREVCDIPVIFITAYTDPDTVERIHEQVPGAPVIAKPLYRERLASAVAEVGAS